VTKRHKRGQRSYVIAGRDHARISSPTILAIKGHEMTGPANPSSERQISIAKTASVPGQSGRILSLSIFKRAWRRPTSGKSFQGDASLDLPQRRSRDPQRRSRDKFLPHNDSRKREDLIAFLAILATGLLLILVGHVAAAALEGFAVVVAALYGLWKSRGPSV
jgi:hypothetical protein